MMRDLYKALGLTSKATSNEIKKAYRSLARKTHSDKGGSDEQMELLNNAYATLSDPVSRRDFEEKWKVYQDTQEVPSQEIENYLPAGESVPYSALFKEEHKAWVTAYQAHPLSTASMIDFLHPWNGGNLYSLQNARDEVSHYHNIFSFIRAKEHASMESNTPIPNRTLSPTLAINVLKNFLSGYYYGERLTQLNHYFTSAIPQAVYSVGHHERLLYEFVAEIIKIAETKTTILHVTLLGSFQKLTEFAKKTSISSSEELTALFYNAHFRLLYGYALQKHWEEKLTPVQEKTWMEKTAQQLEGYQDSVHLLNVMKDRFYQNSSSSGSAQLIKTLRLLSNFEKDVHAANTRSTTAKEFREAAFHLLDWINFFREYTNNNVIINVLIQIALKFQMASQLERNPILQMADQKLALKLYQNSLTLAKKCSSDIEIYASVHVLKQMMLFKFDDEALKRQIPALQNRILVLADFFPFAEAIHSNVDFYLQKNSTIVLMRHLLNTMVRILEQNKTSAIPVTLSHSASTVLYYAYEACLKNWYQGAHDAEFEKKIRLELMENLLADRFWTFADVEVNLNTPWIMVDREKDGWLTPTRALPYGNNESLHLYRGINGAQINNLTGEITFYLTPWNPENPVYQKVFSLFDLQEMLEKNITEGTFSLDLIDPDKPYHPFNKMRLEPTNLDESELLNTMLLTDYMLKFFTTRQEVQGQYPFDQRPLLNMLSHLPKYLRNVIERFQISQTSEGAVHRFWIEADIIDLYHSSFARGYSEDNITESTTKLELSRLKMVVKKHRMKYDMRGELHDTEHDDDGWPIYVLTEEQFEILQDKSHKKYARVAYLVENELTANADKSTIYLQQGEGVLTAYWFDNNDSINQKSLSLMKVLDILGTMHAPILSTNEPIVIQAVLSRYNIFCGKIDGKAMIFIEDRIRLFYWENHQLIKKHVPEDAPGDYHETILCQLYCEPKESNGKIIPTSSNMPILVRAIEVMCQQSGQPNYLSPEFMFTHEFTTHYEEFAQYLPEFGRLRELSRITVLVDYLNRIRENNKKAIKTLDPSTEKMQKEKLQSEFEAIGFAKQRPPEKRDLEDVCFWVPASVLHEQSSVYSSNAARHSFFVYGGVSIHPKVTVKEGNATPLKGTPIKARDLAAAAGGGGNLPPKGPRNTSSASGDFFDGGGNFGGGGGKTPGGGSGKNPGDGLNPNPTDNKKSLRNSDAILYQKIGPNGEHLKFGITKNPKTRYTAEELRGGKLKIIARGARQEMLALERSLHATLPIGPEERQRGYVNVQANKGYKIPPYK